MSCALLLYKFLHLLVIATIGVLFGVPQKFHINNQHHQHVGGEKNGGGKNGVGTLDVNWLRLTCRLVSKSKWNLTEESKNALVGYLNLDSTNLSDALSMLAICQQRQGTSNPDWPKKEDCSCSANVVTASTVMWSAAFVLTIVFDMVAIVTVHVMRVYWSPLIVVCSCLYAAFTVLLWLILGSLNFWYLIEEWPYVVFINSCEMKFYVPAVGWYIASGMCFVAAILPMIEIVIFCWLASRGKGRWRSLYSRKKDYQAIQRPPPATYSPLRGKASPTNSKGEYTSMVKCLESYIDEPLGSYSSTRSESPPHFAKKSPEIPQKSGASTPSPNPNEKDVGKKVPKNTVKIVQKKDGAGRKP